MTESDARAHAEVGELVLAVAGFMRQTVPNRVGGTTVHLIADLPSWERLLEAAARVADKADR